MEQHLQCKQFWALIWRVASPGLLSSSMYSYTLAGQNLYSGAAYSFQETSDGTFSKSFLIYYMFKKDIKEGIKLDLPWDAMADRGRGWYHSSLSWLEDRMSTCHLALDIRSPCAYPWSLWSLNLFSCERSSKAPFLSWKAGWHPHVSDLGTDLYQSHPWNSLR